MAEENPFRRMLEGWGPTQWCKGVMYNMNAACLMGRAATINDVWTTDLEERHRASALMYEKAEALHPDRLFAGHHDLTPIAAFNDHPDTTWGDVEALLEKCAVAWEERI